MIPFLWRQSTFNDLEAIETKDPDVILIKMRKNPDLIFRGMLIKRPIFAHVFSIIKKHTDNLNLKKKFMS